MRDALLRVHVKTVGLVRLLLENVIVLVDGEENIVKKLAQVDHSENHAVKLAIARIRKVAIMSLGNVNAPLVGEVKNASALAYQDITEEDAQKDANVILESHVTT